MSKEFIRSPIVEQVSNGEVIGSITPCREEEANRVRVTQEPYRGTLCLVGDLCPGDFRVNKAVKKKANVYHESN